MKRDRTPLLLLVIGALAGWCLTHVVVSNWSAIKDAVRGLLS